LATALDTDLRQQSLWGNANDAASGWLRGVGG
jgi:hypothetical protein